MLVDAGADTTWVGHDGDSLVLISVRFGSEAVTELLLEAGAPPDESHRVVGTPLFQAATRGQSDVVYALLEAGADPNRSSPISLWSTGEFVFELELEDQEAAVAAIGPVIGLDQELIDSFTPTDDLNEFLLMTLSALPEERRRNLSGRIGNAVPLYAAVIRNDDQVVAQLLDAGADPSLGFGPDRQSAINAADELGRDKPVALMTGSLRSTAKPAED